MITDTGRFVDKQGNSLQFDYDFESLDQTVDIDPQEQEMANRVGVIGVDGLAGPGRMTLEGLWAVTPDQRVAGTYYRKGAVIRDGYGDPERYWQALSDGSTSPDLELAGFDGEHQQGDQLQDGAVVWAYRGASLWQCVRFVKDMWLQFLGQGIIKVYLDDDRFTFAQATNVNLPSWDGLATALRWSVTFSRHDPRWFDETLTTETPDASGGYSVWGPGAVVEEGATCVPTLGNRKWYSADTGGTSGDTEPPFATSGGPWDDDGSAVPFETTVPKSVGDRVVPTGAHACWYEVTAATGTKLTGTDEPPWPATPGDTVTSGEVTFTARAMPVWSLGGDVTQRTASSELVNLGTAPTAPVIVLAVPKAELSITIVNLTLGQTCTIAGTPSLAGDLEIDCWEGTVRIGVIDQMTLFDGEFPTLGLGSNELQVSWFDPGPTSITFKYRNQYW